MIYGKTVYNTVNLTSLILKVQLKGKSDADSESVSIKTEDLLI